MIDRDVNVTNTLRVQREAGNACLTVRDTGVGIVPDALPQVFERFFGADPARWTGDDCCRRFDEVDWCSIVGADDLVLILPVQVLRELDEH